MRRASAHRYTFTNGEPMAADGSSCTDEEEEDEGEEDYIQERVGSCAMRDDSDSVSVTVDQQTPLCVAFADALMPFRARWLVGSHGADFEDDGSIDCGMRIFKGRPLYPGMGHKQFQRLNTNLSAWQNQLREDDILTVVCDPHADCLTD